MEIGGKAFVKIPIFEPYRKLYGHWVLFSLKLEVIDDPLFVSVKVKPTLSFAMSICCMLHQVCSCPIVKMFYNGLISSFESIPPNEWFCLIWTQLQVTFIYRYPLFCLPEKWSGLRKKTFVPTDKKTRVVLEFLCITSNAFSGTFKVVPTRCHLWHAGYIR